MSERLIVDEPVALFEFLAAKLDGWHRNTLRERLRGGCVLVNDETATRRDHVLKAGDVVEVVARGQGRKKSSGPKGLERLFEDEHLIAINKPAGLL